LKSQVDTKRAPMQTLSYKCHWTPCPCIGYFWRG